MGLITEYLGYRFIQDPGPSAGKGKEFELFGTVSWTVDIARVNARGLDGLVADWNAQGYKIGLLLLEGQQIESFVYGGASLESIPEATADLDSAFGTPRGYRWAGWGRSSGNRQFSETSPNVVTFKVHVRLAGEGPACQLIPVVSRHWKTSFSQSMPGLWIIRR